MERRVNNGASSDEDDETDDLMEWMESVDDSLDDGDRAETSTVEGLWRGLIQIFAVHARAGACT